MSNGLELLQEGVSELKVELEARNLINVMPWDDIYLKLADCLKILNTANSSVDNYQIKIKHPLEQMGLENLTLALYEDGSTFKEISDYHKHREFEISPKEIQTWIEEYSNKTVLAKVDLEFGSIFDTQIQLQSLFENLQTQLKAIELKGNADYAGAKTSKDEVYLSYCSEIRQAIKDAAALTEAISNMQRVEEFQKIVLECVNEIDPSIRNKIIRKWKQHKQLGSGFM